MVKDVVLVVELNLGGALYTTMLGLLYSFLSSFAATMALSWVMPFFVELLDSGSGIVDCVVTRVFHDWNDGRLPIRTVKRSSIADHIVRSTPFPTLFSMLHGTC
jgi:hypothetical protein